MNTLRKRPLGAVAGFTLIELLVVVAIIALLIAILLPSLGRARTRAKNVVCESHLKQIYVATETYASEYGDHFPDIASLGYCGFRVAPGVVYGWGPGSTHGETYGLAALLLQTHCVTETSKSWMCPLAPSQYEPWGNTYQWSLAAGNMNMKDRAATGNDVNKAWVNDDYSLLPYVSAQNGVIGGIPPGTTIAAANRVYWHKNSASKDIVNVVSMAGVIYEYAPASLSAAAAH